MSSKILPQAIAVFPRMPVISPCSVKFGHHASNLRIPRLALSSFSSVSVMRRNIAVRAEDDSAAAIPDSSTAVEDVVDGEGDGEGEVSVVVIEEGSTTVKEPRTPRIKLGEIMGILNKRAVEASDEQRPIPDVRPGDVVQIKLEVPSNRRRLSIYKGIVMSKQNAGIHTTIRIRRIIAGVGVEIVFPVHSPSIKEIKVMSHRKVRRAKLYYLRDKLPRFSTFK